MTATRSLVFLLMALAACGQGIHTPALVADAPESTGKDTLKVHMKSGDLYMLHSWTLNSAERQVTGDGRRFNALRIGSDTAGAVIHLDSVALFETNKPGNAWPLGAQGVAITTTVGAWIAVSCLADPKSCFGSCPTFYVEGTSPGKVQAEGFSASVASVLEARDVDAMPLAGATGRRVALHMKNEAWETHVVRSVNLLVAPKPPGGNVYAATDSLFYAASRSTPPVACAGPEGSCLTELSRLDGVERRSAADSTDLATREVIELTFAGAPDRAGLVLTARNSLITTFLFYQSMAYVGKHVGGMVASFERNGREFAERHFGMARLLGDIDVEVLVDGRWTRAGHFGEPGPIAADTKVVPLVNIGGAASDSVSAGRTLRVRLRMAKGHWRIDQAALVTLGEPVAVTRVMPSRVERGSVADTAALAALLDSARTLVSLPGDDFRIRYDLPAPAETLELLLESQGWYYEWMREEWLAEENPLMAAMIVADPARALRKLAPAYKRGESRMEELFWESRFNRVQGGAHVSNH